MSRQAEPSDARIDTEPLFTALADTARAADAQLPDTGVGRDLERRLSPPFVRLSTYRKLHPGPLEEIVFYDHPSGYTRAHNSMLWLAENQDIPTANAPVAPPLTPLTPLTFPPIPKAAPRH